MNHPQLDQAREWAENGAVKVNSGEVVYEIAKAAVRVIQSLPDQWIDAEKLREVLDRWAVNPFPTSDEVAVLNDVESLLTPKLPTLADMSMSERDERKWAQADMEQHGRGIITCILDDSVQFMKGNGLLITVWEKDYGKVTPLTDLPRLEWPGQEAPNEETPPAETLHNTSSGHSADLPRPEDVPDPQPGEAWLIEYRGKRYEALFWYSELYAHWTFGMGREGTFTVESPEATPIARLVPEVGA